MRASRLLANGGLAGLLLVFASWGGPAPAAEVGACLPEGTRAVLTINVKQTLQTPLVKSSSWQHSLKAFQKSAALQSLRAMMGFDPFRDLQRVTIAYVSRGKEDEIVGILHGHFDTSRFHAVARRLVRANDDWLKTHKIGDLTCYQLGTRKEHGSLSVWWGFSSKEGCTLKATTNGGSPLELVKGLQLVLVDKNTLVATWSEDVLKEVCARVSGKTSKPANQKLRHLLEEVGSKQSIAFALVATATTAAPPKVADVPIPTYGGVASGVEEDTVPPGTEEDSEAIQKAAKAAADAAFADALKQIPSPPPDLLPTPTPSPDAGSEDLAKAPASLQEMSVGIALDDDFQLRGTLRAGSTAAAKEIMKGLEDLRLRANGLVLLLAGSDRGHSFLKEIPRSFLAVRKGRIILVEGRLSPEILENMLGESKR